MLKQIFAVDPEVAAAIANEMRRQNDMLGTMTPASGLFGVFPPNI